MMCNNCHITPHSVSYHLVDSRVEILAEELGSLPMDRDFDPISYVNRITRLHSEVTAEEDKVTLLGLRKVLLDLCDRQILQQGGNIDALRAARKSEDRMLCIQKAMVGDQIDPELLARVVTREIESGRIDDPEFLNLASAGASVLGHGNLRPVASESWLSKLFVRIKGGHC
ncbi:MAG: hypothetical protein RL481_1544 [Pseudomonadota bacterium]